MRVRSKLSKKRRCFVSRQKLVPTSGGPSFPVAHKPWPRHAQVEGEAMPGAAAPPHDDLTQARRPGLAPGPPPPRAPQRPVRRSSPPGSRTPSPWSRAVLRPPAARAPPRRPRPTCTATNRCTPPPQKPTAVPARLRQCLCRSPRRRIPKRPRGGPAPRGRGRRAAGPRRRARSRARRRSLHVRPGGSPPAHPRR